jgi:broad specificity phosphatase PhoE
MAERTIINTLRHAHTTYNGEKRYAGTIDVDLNDQGIRDTQLAAAILRDEGYDVVIASTLKRSYETARIIVDGTVPMVKTDLCNERNFGIMEGMTWEDVKQLVPPVMMIKVGSDLHTVNPKGGEPFEDVWDRAKKLKQLLFREYYGKNILVVSHGVFLQMFNGVMRGLTCIESLALYPANLELARFIFDGYHLAEEKVRKLAGEEGAGW